MRLSTKYLWSPSAKSFAVFIVILLGVIAFVITGVSPNQSGSDTNLAARVGSQPVTMMELQRAVENLNRQTGNEPNRREANIQSALNQLIQEKVFLEEATRIGWTAADPEVAQWIRRRSEFQNEKTKQFDIAAYKKFLKSGFISELDFHKQGRDSVTFEKMSALLILPDVTPSAIQSEKALRDSTEFMLEFATVQPNPEKLRAKIAEESKKYAADAANEAKLKEAYDASKNEFIRPPQVRALSILIAHKDAQRAEGEAKQRSVADAKKLAGEIRTRVLAGESFADIAGRTNDDANAKLAKGDIGWIDANNIDAATATAAFKLSAAEPNSDVIETPFGFRLLKWQESRDRLERKFADVKTELAERTLNEKIKNELSTGIEGEFNKLLSEKKFAEVAALAETHGLEWKAAKKPVTAKTRFIEDLGPSEPLFPVLFSLKTGGDMAQQILDFTGRKSLVRLVSRKDGTAPQGDELRRQNLTDQRIATQTFYTTMQRKLFDVYTSNKEITRYMELLR